ncbi:MAG TPA: glycosyltransferase [Streptosporangiaceae bacterium]
MLAGALELFLVSLGLTYYVATVGAGLRILRQHRKAAKLRLAQEQAAAASAAGAAPALPGRRGGRGHRAAGGGLAARIGARVGARIGAGVGVGQAGELGTVVARRWGQLRTRLDTAEEPPVRAGVLVCAADYVVYFLVPCMNEEAVVEDTVRELLGDPRSRVVVIDDASGDRTAELAAAVDTSRVMVVRRELPDARFGKGPALNAGFGRVLADAAVRGIAASRIVVCVMDADGRLSDGALDAVLPLFADPQVGGVQLPVRIRNRGSILTRMQDLEFWGVCAVAQLGRIASGTVSLGGNGQFTRLAAILEMGDQPWQAQLTEDLDLALALAVRGWRLTSTAGAHVSQQGITGLRALINQRTRWYQGHMQAVRWLRELWSSRQLSHLAMLELTIYLMVPWALVLPWSIIFNYNLLIMLLWVLGWVSSPGLGADLTEKIATLVFWYTLSCIPIYMAGFLYGRQERDTGYIRAFFIGHLLLLGNYVTYAACWRAVYRLITGAHGWEKTRRLAERPQPSPSGQAGVPAQAGPLAAVAAGKSGAGLGGSGLGGSGLGEAAATSLDLAGLGSAGLPGDGDLVGAALVGAGVPGPGAMGPGVMGVGVTGSRPGGPSPVTAGLAAAGLAGRTAAAGPGGGSSPQDDANPTAILVPGPRVATDSQSGQSGPRHSHRAPRGRLRRPAGGPPR